MRGEDQRQGTMYSYISPEQRVPQEAGGEAVAGDYGFGGCRIPAVFRVRILTFSSPVQVLSSQSPSHQTPRFPPTPSIRSTSPSHVRMIKLRYCTLTVIQFPAIIPYVSPTANPPVPRPSPRKCPSLPFVLRKLSNLPTFQPFNVPPRYPLIPCHCSSNSFPCHSYRSLATY